MPAENPSADVVNDRTEDDKDDDMSPVGEFTDLKIICQTIVQHCRTCDLELTATCRIKLRLLLSLLSNQDLKLCFLPLSLTILPTCSASASVAANGIMALYKFCIIIIIIVIKITRQTWDISVMLLMMNCMEQFIVDYGTFRPKGPFPKDESQENRSFSAVLLHGI